MIWLNTCHTRPKRFSLVLPMRVWLCLCLYTFTNLKVTGGVGGTLVWKDQNFLPAQCWPSSWPFLNDSISTSETGRLFHWLLHVLLCQCWQEGAVPQDMRDAKIITLFKNKGERSDCNNYRGISLLSVIGKVFAKVILIRLQKLEHVYPESQCGFRAGRSTIDMVFSLRQLQEKCKEQRMTLYIAFIDLTKAFDLVSRGGLFQDPPKDWLPTKIAEHDQILSHKHERDSAVQRQLLQALWDPQWRTRVRPSLNALWNLLCPALETCLWHSIRGNLSADQIRWQAFQSGLTQSQDKGSWSPHQRHAVRARCSSDNPHSVGAAGTDGPFLSGLQGFQTNQQSEEDKCPQAGYNGTASHHHWGLWAWCHWTVHITWLDHHQQPLLGHWDR